MRQFLLQDDLPPIEDLQIQVDEKECLELGTISSIVDQLVLVEAYPHSAPLNIDSVLFVDHGKKALGKIFDVIGPVAVPIYCIRFNSHDDIETKGISVGDKVFCAPRTEYTSYVILSSIMGKGSDASWKNDVEPPEALIDYSDDEQERKSRKPKKKFDNQRQQPNFNRPRYPQEQQQQYNNYHPQQQYNNYQQHNNYPQYPMSWHHQMQPPPQQEQSNYNSFAGYNRFFARK
jgi:H/ACA ribonucleoprotein complex non-core subunit NAF1